MHLTRSNRAALVILLSVLGCALAWLAWARPTPTVEAAPPARASGAILYVKRDATGTHDGTSWANAFPSLQSALDVATPGTEVWVAAGTYTPTLRTDPADARSVTFVITNGVALYGGFAGDEAHREARDWATHVVTLSGDLLGNDGDGHWSAGDNCYHVTTSSDTDPSAVLDGFTIARGIANGYSPQVRRSGGGLYNQDGSPTVSNCTFRSNLADSGGGMYTSGSPAIRDCIFQENTATSGGGMCYVGDGVTLTNCTFRDNQAVCCFGGMFEGFGGGISGDGSSTLAHCVFEDNQAGRGGGMDAVGHPTLIACDFIGNGANGWGYPVASRGGGMASLGNPTLLNCTFARNQAQAGGGFYDRGGSPTFTNCVLWDNGTSYDSHSCDGCGGGGLHSDGGNPVLTNCTLADNWSCSSWGGSSPACGSSNLGTGYGTLTLRNSIVWDSQQRKGGCPVGANCDHVLDEATDPLFVDSFRLRAGSPAVNAGNDSYVSGVSTDLVGNPRIIGLHVDLGAYEATFGVMITKSVMPRTPVVAGDPVTYALTVDNLSLVTAGGVLITDVVPAYVSRPTFHVSGITLTPTGNIDYFWQAADLAPGAHGVITVTGVISPELRACLTFTNIARVSSATPATGAGNEASVPVHTQGALYVRADARGANDGSTWHDAFADLQAALSFAQAGDEIWVAAGTYTPAQMKANVALYGGFGGDETRRDQRDWVTHGVTLSGCLGVGDACEVDGFTIAGGNPGMWTSGSATISHCIFQNNDIGISTSDSPTISHCIFQNNGTGMSTGGSPTISHCIFLNNWGDGISTYRFDAEIYPTISDCVFQGNLGRGLYNGGGSPTLINCTFEGNAGGALGMDTDGWQERNNWHVRNSILWDNGPNPVRLGYSGDINFDHSLVQGGCPAGTICAQLLDADPLFVDAAQGDLRLRHGSPAIGAGDNAYVPSDMPTDLDGRTRIRGQAVDLGAYEAATGLMLAKTVTPTTPVLAGAALTYVLSVDNLSPVTATHVLLSDALPSCVSRLTVHASGFTLTPTGGIPTTWQVADLPPDAWGVITLTGIITPQLAGRMTFTNTAWITSTLPAPYLEGNAVSVQTQASDRRRVYYVKRDATGAADGSSWADAVPDLQAALTAAWYGEEVWIAAGIYTPTLRTDPADARSATFHLPDGVALYGGFAGRETLREQRDWATRIVTLSGDIGVVGEASDNAYHVVSSLHTDSHSALDGLTIADGNAPSDRPGGGYATRRGTLSWRTASLWATPAADCTTWEAAPRWQTAPSKATRAAEWAARWATRC